MSNSELSDISSKLIRSLLCETIENELKTEKYQINVTSASEAGASNFMGIVHRVSFKRTNENADDSSSLIIKISPQHLERRIQFHSRELFLREIFLYDVVCH